eukprot:2385216-Amphidinium_carterae.1
MNTHKPQHTKDQRHSLPEFFQTVDVLFRELASSHDVHWCDTVALRTFLRHLQNCPFVFYRGWHSCPSSLVAVSPIAPHDPSFNSMFRLIRPCWTSDLESRPYGVV